MSCIAYPSREKYYIAEIRDVTRFRHLVNPGGDVITNIYTEVSLHSFVFYVRLQP
jgi:hypothetical protein